MRFPVQYSTRLPWVTALLATLDGKMTAIRSVSCDIRLVGSIVDALDWDGLGRLLSSETYRTVEGLRFAVNLWSGVHKDFAEVEELIRSRLGAFDKKGTLHITQT